MLIKHCFLMGKYTVEIKQWPNKHYGDSVPGKSTIIDWYAEFKGVEFFFLLISNLDTVRNMPYEEFIRKHAGSNTTDLIIYL